MAKNRVAHSLDVIGDHIVASAHQCVCLGNFHQGDAPTGRRAHPQVFVEAGQRIGAATSRSVDDVDDVGLDRGMDLSPGRVGLELF